jgi:HK97 family phage prohead protease
MSKETEREEQEEQLSGGEYVYRVAEPALMRFVEEDGSAPVLEGRMMPYNEWTEINSSVEGHFMERFVNGALAKTMSEQASRVRALFEHGLDVSLGRQPIAADITLSEEEDGAHYRATLLEGLPPLLLAGLRSGVYGSSVRYRPVKASRVRYPQRSESNPDGIPELTIREAYLKEFSVTPFPQYAGATAHIRSLTDEIAAKQLLKDPEHLLAIIANRTEPQHSEREQTEEPPVKRSRSTQPQRDYLQPPKGDPTWLL